MVIREGIILELRMRVIVVKKLMITLVRNLAFIFVVVIRGMLIDGY